MERPEILLVKGVREGPKRNLNKEVDRYYDGTYRIHGELTVKYPELDEIMQDMIEKRGSDRERFAVVVDVEELLNSAADIEQTVCGFRITADRLEVYDKYDAIRLFGAALKEAYGSGRCVVDEEFY